MARIAPGRPKDAIAFVTALAVSAMPLIAYVIMLAITQSHVATNLPASGTGKDGSASAAKMCGLDFSPVSLASPGTPYQGDWACGNHFMYQGRYDYGGINPRPHSSGNPRSTELDPITRPADHDARLTSNDGTRAAWYGGRDWDGDTTPHPANPLATHPHITQGPGHPTRPLSGPRDSAVHHVGSPSGTADGGECVPTCIFSECVECTWVCYACEIECCDSDGNCWICCIGIDETVPLQRPDYHSCKCGCGGPYCSQWDWQIWPEPNASNFDDWHDGLILSSKSTKRNPSSTPNAGGVAANTAYWAFRDYAGQLVQIDDQVAARLPHVGMIRPPDNVDPTTWPLRTAEFAIGATTATKPPGEPWFECEPTDYGGVAEDPTPQPTHTPAPTPTRGAVSGNPTLGEVPGVQYIPVDDWEHGGSAEGFSSARTKALASDQYSGEAGHIFRSLKIIPTYNVIANTGYFDVYMVLKEENIPDPDEPASVEFIFNFHIHDSTCSNNDGSSPERFCDGDIIVVNAGDRSSPTWGSANTRAWYDPQENEFFNVPGLHGEPGATGIKARINVHDMRAWYGFIELVAAPPDPFEPTLPTATPGGSPRISSRSNPSLVSAQISN